MAKSTNQNVSSKEFLVTQKRSLIACSNTQRLTMQVLGLRGRHKSVVIADNAANRGQIMKVQHLVDVKVQPAGTTKKAVTSVPRKKAAPKKATQASVKA